jgi:hypothetical protein
MISIQYGATEDEAISDLTFTQLYILDQHIQAIAKSLNIFNLGAGFRTSRPQHILYPI